MDKREEIFMPYGVALALNNLIARLRTDCYADMLTIREKIEQLPIKELQEKAEGDNQKWLELINTTSQLTKEQFAWMTKADFERAVDNRGFEYAQMELLEFWIVK